jgi:hypothetical protein
VRQHYSGGGGPGFEYRAQQTVELGIDQHDVLAMLEGVQRDAGGKVDRSGDLHDQVDRRAPRQDIRIVRQHRRAVRDGPFRCFWTAGVQP